MANGVGIELGTHLFLFTPEQTPASPPPSMKNNKKWHIYFGKFLLGVRRDATISSHSYFAKRHEDTLLNVWVQENDKATSLSNETRSAPPTGAGDDAGN